MAVRVLIAEDEPAVAENLEALLRAKGYETKWVADGAQAVAAAKRDRPDVMLLDIMLPKMDGFDVCRLLRADPATQKVKIIVVTGLGRMGDVETAFASGATDYIIKPFDSDRLFKKIEKVLQSPS